MLDCGQVAHLGADGGDVFRQAGQLFGSYMQLHLVLHIEDLTFLLRASAQGQPCHFLTVS